MTVCEYNTAILLAAGSSNRFGERDKMFVEIEVDGIKAPVFVHSVIKFSEIFEELVLVVSSEKKELFKEKIIQYSELLNEIMSLSIVDGGESRTESVSKGLVACSQKTKMVAVHDCARPFIKPSLISEVLQKATEKGGAIVVSPMTDTVKKIDENGEIVETLNREVLVKAETPQVFFFKDLCEGYKKVKKAGKILTDDAAVMEFSGKSVYVVSHFDNNRKITFAADIF